MADPLGVTITYQGKPCGPLFQYTRSTGLEPDYGFVTIESDDFKNDFRIVESVPGVDMVATGKSQEKPGPGTPGFQTAGRLVFQEVVKGENGNETHKVVLEQILVQERGIEVAYADDTDENQMCRVPITDIRLLYKTRGILTLWVNVPMLGVPEVEGTTVSAPSGTKILPGSLNDGKRWTVEPLVRRIARELPGDPVLKIQEPRPAFFDFEVGPKIWNPVLPRDAMAEVLEEFQLVFVLNPDASFSLWDQGSGELQDAKKKFKTFDTSDPACDERIASAKALVTFNYVPPVVVVVGSPTIVADRTLLEPCGLRDGKIVPLADALAGIGLSMTDATKFAVLTEKERSTLLPVSSTGLREFNRWAFKWFRLPGGVEKNAHRLPILDARAAVGKTGELLPHRVSSEHFTQVNRLFLDQRKSPAGAAINLKSTLDELADIKARLAHSADLGDTEKAELKGRKETLERQAENLAKAIAGEVVDPNAVGNFKDADKSLSDAREAFESSVKKFGLTSPEASQAFAEFTASKKQFDAAKKSLGRLETVAEKIAGRLQGVKSRYILVLVNLEFEEATRGFEIDNKNGVVMFSEVQGHVFPIEGSDDPLPTAESCRLSEFAMVELEYAYVRKPSPDEQISLGCSYFSVWVREGDGKDAKVTSRDKIPPGTAPLVIHRPELQLVEGFDKTKNAIDKLAIDITAGNLARGRLKAEQSSEGGVVNFARPVPIVNTGLVLSVSWACDSSGRPSTTAHVGVFSKLATPPGDRAPAQRGASPIAGAVYLPPGVSGR